MYDNEGNVESITMEQNMVLTVDLSFEKFMLVVKQMHPNKASGPDGSNPAFFQYFWLMLGREVFSRYKEWLRSCMFPANLNDTNVVLIPKTENAESMKDLRPIALCNILYYFPRY